MNRTLIQNGINAVLEDYTFEPINKVTLSNIAVSLEENLDIKGASWEVKHNDHSLTFSTRIDGKDVSFQYKVTW